VIGVKRLPDVWDDTEYLSVAKCAERMNCSTARVRLLAERGVLLWRRNWISGDVEVEPAVIGHR
jgi:hypothetical protein